MLASEPSLVFEDKDDTLARPADDDIDDNNDHANADCGGGGGGGGGGDDDDSGVGWTSGAQHALS